MVLESQLPLIIPKKTLANLCGNWLTQNQFINTFCEISSHRKCLYRIETNMATVYSLREGLAKLGYKRPPKTCRTDKPRNTAPSALEAGGVHRSSESS